MIKTRNINYILIATVLVFIVGEIILSYLLNKEKPVPVSQKENITKEEIQEIQKEEEFTPLISAPPEERWKKYTSSELGFSIKYPQMVYGSSYRCGSKKPFYVPLKVFEDDKNGIVYIVKEYFYRGKYDEKLGKYIGPCEKVTRSLKLLQDGGWLGKWSVLFRTVKNEDELNKFVKDNYGLGCFAGEKELWKQEGVYEIRIKGEDWGPKTNLGTTTCPWNYNYKILYAPEKNKLMSVNLGQECSFGTRYISEELYECYDNKMINSFKFDDDTDQNKNGKSTYTIFSSPKADFTFEYPDTWVYDEEKDPYNLNTTNWSFYLNPEKNPEDLILLAVSPLSEIVDFCSIHTRNTIYQLNIFPTNNPETYVTYEQCGGEYGSAYIYWQKGKYFANANDIKDYHEINLMKFYSGTENKENMNIIQHIAQSIKIK